MTYERYNPIGKEEIQAVNKVMKSGTLSSFIGAWCEDFFGGPEVRAFEKELAEHFNVKHAITFNSLTSGLISAVGAIGVEPGDEVIVSPWTMSATATAIIIWGGIPVFADIEEDYYGLDPNSVRKIVTDKTKAIIATDIFGHGAKLDQLKDIANENKIKLIEDVAQAPGVLYKNKYCGKWGDIGGFSLNYHKHIHTGEGGFCITDDDRLALKMQMIRNHAESSIEGSPLEDYKNMLGFNFRMGEIEATIGRCQLRKLDLLLEKNITKANAINSILSEVEEFKLACLEEESNHAFYVLPINIVKRADLRSTFIDMCNKSEIPGLFSGYVNVHKLPMYQRKEAFGKGYPWSLADNDISYQNGICPVAEKLKDKSFIGLLVSMYEINIQDAQIIAHRMVSIWKSLL